jgi:hypothetical protein
MNLRQHHEEARRRRLINRSAAQHRQIMFETIRGTTVNYSTAPVRRSTRQQPGTQDIDDPRMTFALQASIVLAMLGTVMLFHAPLASALKALFA